MRTFYPVPGFGGKYIVGRDGEVYSCHRKGRIVPGLRKKLKHGITNDYHYVYLRDGGQTIGRAVHRLVCEVFHGLPKTHMHVNHKNGNKVDNRPENLEWVTQAENNQHAWDTGLAPPIANYNEDRKRPIIGVCVKTGKELYRFNSIRDAERHGHSQWRIGLCLHGRAKLHHGCYWRDV